MKFFKNVSEYNKDCEQEEKNNDNVQEETNLERVKSKEIIKSDFKGQKLFEIGDIPTERNPVFLGDHIGGFMRTDDGIITIGICVKNNERMPYKINKKTALAYTRQNDFFLSEAIISDVRDANEEDMKELDILFQNRMQNLISVLGSVKFIIADMIIISEAKKQNRRKHLRVAVNWTVYFKIINPDGELKKAEQQWLKEKRFETSHGYFKTQTIDVSAGGYKSMVKANLPANTELDCVMEIKGNDNMKAVGRVRGQVLGCHPNQTRKGVYDMRVKFMDMPDATMAMMEKQIESIKKK